MEGVEEGEEEEASKRVLEWQREPCGRVPYVQHSRRVREALHHREHNEKLGCGTRNRGHKKVKLAGGAHKGGLGDGVVRCLFHVDEHRRSYSVAHVALEGVHEM